MKLEVLGMFSIITQISNFIKIRPLGAQFFQSDGQTDRRDEANSRFSHLWNAPKYSTLSPTQCNYLFCMDLRINSDFFPIQHYLTGFYNRDGMCLLRGTD